MTLTATELRLRVRPEGLPTEECWDVASVEVPEPAEGQFLVAVDHVSLDPAMRGWLRDEPSYLPPVQIGEVMRANGTGTVLASAHPKFAVGDTVVGSFGVRTHALSDGRGVRAIDTSIAPQPTWLGALGGPGLTAWFGLHEIGQIKAGDTVVISAAAGAVGSVAGQLAKAQGCTVIGIAGGPEKCAWIRELGYDVAIDYKNDDVEAALRFAAPEGIDVYFDNVGGDILDAALVNMAHFSRIVACGQISNYNATEQPGGPRNIMRIVSHRITMRGFIVFDFIKQYPEALSSLGELVTSGDLTVRETILEGGVDSFNEALTGLFTGRNTGKLVLKLT